MAEFFEKQHKHVLRDITKITEPTSGLSEEFIKKNFVADSYKDSTGRTLRCYPMTHGGFTMLVMGYTGAKAMRFKELYIKRFNEMEEFIKTLVSARQEFPLSNALLEAFRIRFARRVKYSSAISFGDVYSFKIS
ncbi:MAG: Rha family transcriptional regulator [Ruminococcus flavefaciens]|nr:Rha family transcriptional regulator [Ruminococcus flavefaciens]